MPTYPIAYFRDDFADNARAAAWGQSYSNGSATQAETSGQAQFTLPSNTAGSHETAYWSTGAYDITGDGCFINVAQMVSTSVAAYAVFDLRLDASNKLRWIQQSGTLRAQKIVAGVTTDVFSVAWNATTYRYWRIRESGGTVFWDSSSTGTSWTNRASATVASLFAVTAFTVVIAAGCGNVASPGSFRIDEFNTILPALTTNWNWTKIEWPEWHRFRDITLAATSGQGIVVTMKEQLADGTWVNPQYWSGPLAVNGGVLTLTAYTDFSMALAMAVNLPANDRWTLPSMQDCRIIILYHRSITGSSYTLREFFSRRLVQADDIEAEVFRGLRFEGHQFICDRLSALTANIGRLTVTSGDEGAGWIYQGTGTGDAPITGLKLFNVGGLGKFSGYNAGIEQITFDTDGKLKAGGGTVLLDANGVGITGATFSFDLDNPTPVTLPRVNTIEWSVSGAQEKPRIVGSNTGQLLALADVITLAIPINNQDSYGLHLQENGAHSLTGATFTVRDAGSTSGACFTVTTNLTAANSSVLVRGALNVGSATGAASGDVKASGNVHLTAGRIRMDTNYAATPQSGASVGYFEVNLGGVVVKVPYYT